MVVFSSRTSRYPSPICESRFVTVTSPAAPPAPERRSSLHAFKHRRFLVFWIAAAISNGGSWMQAVAAPAFLYSITDSATWLGVASVAMLAPAIIITPYAGALADRVSRRKILIITQSVQTITAAAMVAMYAAGSLTPESIVAIGFVNGVATGFQASVWQSFVPLLVPREEMLDAVKLNSMQFTLARAIGPAFAGVVVKTIGFGAAFAINGATYLLVIGALVVARPRPVPSIGSGEPVRRVVLAGARYMLRHRPLRIAILISFLTASFGQSMQYIAPAIASRVFDRPSTDNAALLVALGVGALVSSWFSVIVGDRMRRSRRLLLGISLFATSAGILVFTDVFFIGLVAYFVGGLAHLQIAVGLNTLVQGVVPEHMRGRAMSFYVLGIIAGIPIGSFVVGRLADVFDIRTALAVSTCALVATAAWLVTSGGLKTLDIAELPDD
jgi:MFS family permease